MPKSSENSVSLNKYISNQGFCSRREADKYIEAGRVTINDKPARLGNRVLYGDIVKIDHEPIYTKPKPLYIAFHKPTGLVSTTDPKEKSNIINYINHPQRLFPIGRLDKNSEGLIFLTNDGDIVNKILRAGNNHEKEYIVTVKQEITSDFLSKMRSGVRIMGTVTKKCRVSPINKFTFKITLTQGLNRQIRKMCKALKFDVTKLKRTRIMNVSLKNLKLGMWRNLTPLEIEQIQKMVSGSSKTEEASKDKNNYGRRNKMRPKQKTSKHKRNKK
ncbi:MAG: 23S rRNA pseudouridine(2604) synthase RluF [Saprospiraceae bacterium]|nr:23S rRNA pseudouridine(2604) synthase RluF [Bacteroidia bacterium]NNE16185.1 23S rRNA pseudouridine(2604) synthase RluF [Saprospiraceae bacterium]NNL92392.1 23S rRNA pseudouridine(2604) synthase RluF [Saprospiraceae bacterium]